ncbi:hypothetical protein BJV78DRAFT_1154701 [Lactifluus subvellereus]|nr:hypothetical protein BJV78DRAFT_1154701 [Lactifluus subvellereus]
MMINILAHESPREVVDGRRECYSGLGHVQLEMHDLRTGVQYDMDLTTTVRSSVRWLRRRLEQSHDSNAKFGCRCWPAPPAEGREGIGGLSSLPGLSAHVLGIPGTSDAKWGGKSPRPSPLWHPVSSALAPSSFFRFRGSSLALRPDVCEISRSRTGDASPRKGIWRDPTAPEMRNWPEIKPLLDGTPVATKAQLLVACRASAGIAMCC